MGKLDNIDDGIRNAFENFEVPFDGALWNSIESKLDHASSGNDLTSFDKKIKESVAGHEAAYSPAAWTAVESQLVTSYSYTKWFLAAGLIGLVSLGVYFIVNTEKESSSAKNDQPKEKLAENNSVQINEVEENEIKTNSGTLISDESDEKISDSGSEKNTQTENKAENPIEKTNPVKTESTSSNTELSKNTNGDPEKNQEVKTEPVKENKWSIENPSIIGKFEMCEGEELKLASSEVTDKVSIQWMMNGVPVSNNEEIILKNLNSGSHEIELIHRAKDEFKAACTKPELKKTLLVTVKENSTVDFKYLQEGDAFYPETKFSVLSPEKGAEYSWILDNKSFLGEEVVYLFNHKGNYPVILHAEKENGCISEEVKNIEISTDYNLLAPFAFTPNFDGINDVFIPEALKFLNLPFKMNIHDRQQGLVYQSTRSDAPWDGRNINTGELCGQGAYLWVVELTNKAGEVEQFSGTITILK